MEKFDLYQQITNQLIEILDTHKQLNYSCNWTAAEVMAKNIVTGRNYSGFNQIYLSFIASRYYNFNRWITFKQGYNLHATVKKGEIFQPGIRFSCVNRNSLKVRRHIILYFFTSWAIGPAMRNV